MEWGALLVGFLSLLVALLDERRTSAPARKQAEREHQYDADVQRANDAIRNQSGGAIASLFEEERQRAIQRGDLDPRGPGAELRPDTGAADRGPGDRAAG